ncbi:Pre-mRNA-splicing factor 18 [Trichoplax sp. H2]|nr:Pre-mRNA-splicing factor 18 [Trichoplax sp. H2]|eukprot:RDD43830.1 Pre-mRNA-splicing factor 18 [Trichoplax sp. H2]
MDALKAEIERKRKQLLENSAVNAAKKRFRRGDLENSTDLAREEVTQDNELSKDEAENNSIELSANDDYSNESLIKSKVEVIRRLRERGEPIRLFGETDADVVGRLRRIEFMAPEVNKGLRNDFKAAMDKIDQEYLDELINQQVCTDDDIKPDTTDKSEEVNARVLSMSLEDFKDVADDFNSGNSKKDQEVILSVIKGKLQSAIHKQTKRYMKPLLKKLKKNKVEESMLRALTEIVVNMLDREYVKANDIYVRMAIGNAAWPIGVTMVGIHARTGREKIFAQHVAHVLNDETQRKYIQGFKRLMTRCQMYFPTDPSKSVEYQGHNE